jgi:hypothetical protein
MSQFIGNAQSQFRLEANDTRTHMQSFQTMHVMEGGQQDTFASPWWPGSGFIGDRAVDVGVVNAGQKWYEYPEVTKGMNSRLGIAGVTRDQYGSAIVSCTVKLFKTSDDSLVSQIVSDATTGEYLLSTPYYPDTHYVVAYKAGSPDIAGATVNTLIGS